MAYTYKIHHLPASDPVLIPFLAGKFSSLRLAALTTSQTSFSSTFERESVFTASQWIARLQRPGFHNFIAVAYAAGTLPEFQTIDAGDWVGSATLIGPVPRARFELLESGGPSPGDDEVESKWQMTAVYNSPEHRGRGVAKMLIQGAMDFAVIEGEGRGSRMRIMIHPKNVLVKTLYGNLGFEEAGKMTLVEACVANGDAEMVPSDGGEGDRVKYHSRLGIVMERVVRA